MENLCNHEKYNIFISRLDEISKIKGGVLPALQEAQGLFGYLTPEIVETIADKLNLSSERVYEVASFYSQFKLAEVGKHRISVCLGTACYVKGAQDVMDKVSNYLGIKEGQSTKDAFFSLESVRCVGCCALAPVFMIDDKVYAKVTPEDAIKAIEEFRKNNS